MGSAIQKMRVFRSTAPTTKTHFFRWPPWFIGKDKNHYQSELNCTLETYSKHPSSSDVLMLIVSILHRTDISDSHLRVPLQTRMTIAMGRCQTWNGAHSAHTRKQPCEIPLIMQWKSLSSWQNHWTDAAKRPTMVVSSRLSRSSRSSRSVGGLEIMCPFFEMIEIGCWPTSSWQ